MENLNIIQLVKTLIYGVGGPTLIILGISKFLGEYFSKREIESLKSTHNRELEETKSKLERTKSQFFRYSEKQFELYNNLWLVLVRTRDVADALWEDPSPAKLPGFAEQIRITRQAVTDNMLLIEEGHYDDLDILLKEFEHFQFGKQKLIEIRGSTNSKPKAMASKQDVKNAILMNKSIKSKYTNLILKIGKSFRDQIKG